MSDHHFAKTSAVVAIVGALLGCWVQYRTSEFDGLQLKLDQINGAQQRLLAQSAESRSERESRERYWQWIHEKLVGALQRKSAPELRVVYHYIGTLQQKPAHEGDLKLALLQLVEEQSADGALAIQAGEDKKLLKTYEADQAALASRPPSAATGTAATKKPFYRTDIDVFWCEANGAEYQAHAERLAARIQNDLTAGRVRARMLPNIVNSGRGYGISRPTVTVDYDVPRERDYAKTLASLIAAAVPGSLADDVDIKQTSQGTPHYLGVFLCSA